MDDDPDDYPTEADWEFADAMGATIVDPSTYVRPKMVSVAACVIMDTLAPAVIVSFRVNGQWQSFALDDRLFDPLAGFLAEAIAEVKRGTIS